MTEILFDNSMPSWHWWNLFCTSAEYRSTLPQDCQWYIGTVIYSLLLRGEVQYVGQTTRINRRVDEHHYKSAFGFDDVRIREIVNFRSRNPDFAEQHWIDKLKPKFNVARPGARRKHEAKNSNQSELFAGVADQRLAGCSSRIREIINIAHRVFGGVEVTSVSGADV